MRFKFLKKSFLFVWFYLFFSTGQVFCATESGEETYSVFRGVSHVHTQFSHDSNASLDLVIKNAQAIDLDFVVVTDHNSLEAREFYKKMDPPARPLVIFGDEVSAADGHLIGLGIREHPPEMPSQQLIDWIHASGGYAILAHPFTPKNPWKNWSVEEWDGLEVYDFGHNLLAGDIVDFAVRSLYEDKESLLSSAQNISDEDLAFLDDLLKERAVSMVAGVDAHLKNSTKHFEWAFQSVALYVLAKQLNEEEIIKAMATGKVFMVFETHGSAEGFSYWAEQNGQIFNLGDTLEAGRGASLHVHLPILARIRLIHDGVVAAEELTQEMDFPASEPGAYRVEVYQDDKPWIYSNPIYLRSSN